MHSLKKYTCLQTLCSANLGWSGASWITTLATRGHPTHCVDRLLLLHLEGSSLDWKGQWLQLIFNLTLRDAIAFGAGDVVYGVVSVRPDVRSSDSWFDS